jgi:hypothetical protein
MIQIDSESNGTFRIQRNGEAETYQRGLYKPSVHGEYVALKEVGSQDIYIVDHTPFDEWLDSNGIPYPT